MKEDDFRSILSPIMMLRQRLGRARIEQRRRTQGWVEANQRSWKYPESN